MQTTEYKRGYANGYNAGRKRAYRYLDRIVAIARELRERAERAEIGLGFGTCSDCQHWKRHHDKAKWGPCAMGKMGVDWERPWANAEGKGIDTSEAFGCVRFQHRP
jgi:hypothetical protein